MYTGRKWKAAVEASNMDSRIKTYIGNMQIGRTVLWHIKRGKRFNNTRQQNRRAFLKVIRKAEHERISSARTVV